MRALKIILLSILLTGILFGQEEKPFKISATLSYNGTGGNTKTHSLSFKGDVGHILTPVQVDWGGGYNLAMNEGEKDTESMNLYSGIKMFFLKDRLYALYKSEWRRNTFSGFEHRLSNIGGLGVVVVNDDLHSLNVEGGINYIYERYVENEETGERPEPDKSGALHAGTNYTLNISQTAQLKSSLSWDMNLKDSKDQLLVVDGGLNLSITGWLSVGVVEKLTYDNLPLEDYEKTDYETTVGLTVSNF